MSILGFRESVFRCEDRVKAVFWAVCRRFSGVLLWFYCLLAVAFSVLVLLFEIFLFLVNDLGGRVGEDAVL